MQDEIDEEGFDLERLETSELKLPESDIEATEAAHRELGQVDSPDRGLPEALPKPRAIRSIAPPAVRAKNSLLGLR